MSCTISPLEIKRVKGMGFLNNKGTDLFNARIITVNQEVRQRRRGVHHPSDRGGPGRPL